jgi:peptide deformylase
MALKIVTGEDKKILRTKTKRVPAVTKDVQKFLKDMEKATVAADGLGLAAPQVGSDLRMCVARINGRLTPLVNPEITWKSKATETAEEGCLSLPGVWVPVPRATEIVVKYQTARGDRKELKLSDMDARVVQHETDHLDGKLIVDYVSAATVL